MSTLISVIIPVYNVREYLPQCLDSVIRQTYQNIEILVVDDGSTDGSLLICDEFAGKDPRIRVIRAVHGGISAARNIGIENANGVYLTFFDGDDWMEPDAIDTYVRIAKQTGADISCIGSSTEYVDRTHHPKIGLPTDVGETVELDDGRKVRVFRGGDVLTAYVNSQFREVVWNKMFRAEVCAGIRFAEGRTYEDVDLTWRIMKNLAESGGTAAALPDELIRSRMRRSSITHTYSLKNIVDHWLAQYGRYEGLPEYQDRYIGACLTAVGRMWMSYSGFSKDDQKKAEETIRQMQAFSRANRRKVLRGKHSRYIKMVCLLSQTRTPLAMELGARWGRRRHAVRRREKGELFV